MSLDTIPAFVFRGLSTRDNPTDRTDVSMGYRNEADLRDCIASFWWMNGWHVRTEVKIPACGRVDVLAEVPGFAMVIEVKREVTTPTHARQAAQQAHAYLSYLRAGSGDDYLKAVVVAADISWPSVRASSLAYPSVEFEDFATTCTLSDPNRWAIYSDDLALRIAARERAVNQLASALRSHQVGALSAIEQVVA